jgi:hypothetical protein
VPVNDDLGGGERLVQLRGVRAAELIAMRHDYREAFQLYLGDLRELRPQFEAVTVAINRRHRRQGAQLDQQVAASDIPTMKDVIDFSKDVEHSRPQNAVRVRDDAESHFNSDAVT